MLFSFSEAAEEEVLAQRPAITPKEVPASFHKSGYSEKGRKGIDAERFLTFRLHPGSPVGLELADTTSGTGGPKLASLLVVANVEATSSFAKTVDGEIGITVGDTIVEANGRRGTATDLRKVLQQEKLNWSTERHVTLVVRPRPPAFDVDMLREGPQWETLGITVVIDKNNPGCALVQALRSEGLVPDWNRTHGSLRICAGDLITQVNDLYEDAKAMCEEIQTGRRGSRLRFRVCTSIAGQAMARSVSCRERQTKTRTDAEAHARSEAEIHPVRARVEAEEQICGARWNP